MKFKAALHITMAVASLGALAACTSEASTDDTTEDTVAAATVTTVVSAAASADPELQLGQYFEEVLDAPPDLASCYAKGAAELGLSTVGDLQAAEEDPALVDSYVAMLDQCVQSAEG